MIIEPGTIIKMPAPNHFQLDNKNKDWTFFRGCLLFLKSERDPKGLPNWYHWFLAGDKKVFSYSGYDIENWIEYFGLAIIKERKQ